MQARRGSVSFFDVIEIAGVLLGVRTEAKVADEKSDTDSDVFGVTTVK